MRGLRATKTPSALKRLEDLNAAVREGEARLSEVELERNKVAHSLDRVVAPLRSYHEDLAAGEREPDAALERQLAAAVNKVQSDGLVKAQPSYVGGHILDMKVIDERVEARFAGTQRLVQTRINERNAFIREHAEELQAELLEQAEAVTDSWPRGTSRPPRVSGRGFGASSRSWSRSGTSRLSFRPTRSPGRLRSSSGPSLPPPVGSSEIPAAWCRRPSRSSKQRSRWPDGSGRPRPRPQRHLPFWPRNADGSEDTERMPRGQRWQQDERGEWVRIDVTPRHPDGTPDSSTPHHDLGGHHAG